MNGQLTIDDLIALLQLHRQESGGFRVCLQDADTEGIFRLKWEHFYFDFANQRLVIAVSYGDEEEPVDG